MINQAVLDLATQNVKTKLTDYGDSSFSDVERAIKMHHPWPASFAAILRSIIAEYHNLEGAS